MYRPFYGLKRLPFSREVAPDDIFGSPELDELHTRLLYLVDTKGIGLLLGEPGAGKSTALRRLRAALHPDQVRPVYLFDTAANARDFFRHIALELGIEPQWSRSMNLRAIQAEIVRLVTERKLKVMLVIDEAHRLRPDVLLDLAILCNFEWDSANRLTMILAGQSALRSTLRLATLEAITQRITLRYTLRGFDRDTCRLYLEHRLTSAGCDRPVFSQPAIESIYNATGGVMRRIDAIAHHALAAAAIQKDTIVDIEHIQRAAEEIRP